MIVCMYHKSDLDGICSAAIVNHFHNIEDHSAEEVLWLPMDYTDPVDWVAIDKVSGVVDYFYILDFSLEPVDMQRLIELVGLDRVVWIDHHKSAIEKYSDFPVSIKGLREIGMAGCELTWGYIHSDVLVRPLVVFLLGRYDVWDSSNKSYWESIILPFQYGMRSYGLEPTDSEWGLLFDSGRTNVGLLDQTIEHGNTIIKYTKISNKILMNQVSYEIEWEGYRCLVANHNPSGSQLFESKWDEDKHDVMVGWAFNGERYLVSLYSTKDSVDVSEIAVKCKEEYPQYVSSGGGHRGASGLVCTELPWKMK